MGEGFQRRRGGGAVATMSGFEADLLRSLASQLIELLRDEAGVPTAEVDPFEALLDFSGPSAAPEDPVLARLLPSAYRDDDEAAAEFRRFTEVELRTSKAGNAATLVAVLEDAGLPEVGDPALTSGLFIDVELADAEVLAVLKVFTDIRLALATRLDLQEGDEDFWDSLPDDDPRTHLHDVYEWVGWLQETLVTAAAR
jgi:hypothetical protein